MAEPDFGLLSSYAGLLTLAGFSIYAGSYGSLTTRKPEAATKGEDLTEEDDEEEIPERIGSGDAYLFPIIGSALLFGLYLVVRYLGAEWLNYLLQWYFTIAGVGSVGKTLISLAKWYLGQARWRQFEKIQFLVLKGPREMVSVSMRSPSPFLLFLAVIPSTLYYLDSNSRRSALLTDILGISFAHNALSLLKIDSFPTGCILLSGLFLYDIWWVFGTEVMVKVATSLDIPIKLLWPKSLTFAGEHGYTMLGLGDIVIPGMFIALALRYDYHRSGASANSASFSKPYFIAALFAYVLGLTTTMAVMHFFKSAQPALLYLSPACILSFVITALVRGELLEAWKWSDEPERKDSETHVTTNGTSNSDIVSEAAQEAGPALSADKTEDSINAEEAHGQEEAKAKKKRTKKKN